MNEAQAQGRKTRLFRHLESGNLEESYLKQKKRKQEYYEDVRVRVK